ncbi:MAG: regulatory protein RecX [Acidiferrobacteraceae bacterium]
MQKPIEPIEPNALYRKAVRALARREYAVAELRKRLSDAAPADEVESVLSLLCRAGLLSDARYAAVRSATARRRGWGPVRLRRELETRGVAAETVNEVVGDSARRWVEEAAQVRRRRFGADMPKTPAETARQIRFLQGRGFTMEQIRRVLRPAHDDGLEQG